ncbi:MAG: DNA-directed RNA polymerase subunit omega [Clostridia bacterium]|nr:DNA-directed RNA polymerase subunit omega [Clostridia bacterium]MDY4144593.1 DNA-directed RNA polymerase subunit omega [Bacilli bacterium]
MLFEPPIDDLVKKVGNKYALTVLMAGRARELQKKIPAMTNDNANNAILMAAEEVLAGQITAVKG